MKRFFQKIALRLLLLAVLWIAFTRMVPKYVYMGSDYLRWETVFGAIAGSHQQPLPRNLILGDSRPEMGLDARQLRAANFAIGGSSFPEGLYILQQLAHQPIDTLYLSYAPYHFQSMDCFYTRTDFFGFVENEYMDEVIALAEREQDSVYLRKSWAWLRVLDSTFYLKPIADEFRYVHNYYDLKQWRWYFNQGKTVRENMVADQYSYLVPAKGCPGDSVSHERKLELAEAHFRVTAVNAHYLSEILKLADKRKIQVVWLNMPLSDATEQPTASYMSEFDHALNFLLPESVPIVPFRTRAHCDFRDFNHLHEGAARAHTGWLRAYLRDSLRPAAMTGEAAP